MLTTDPSTLPFVSDGISNGRTWATYRRKTSGALKRIVSPATVGRSTPSHWETGRYHPAVRWK